MNKQKDGNEYYLPSEIAMRRFSCSPEVPVPFFDYRKKNIFSFSKQSDHDSDVIGDHDGQRNKSLLQSPTVG